MHFPVHSWHEAAAFPVLTTMTLTPLASMAAVLCTRSMATALRFAFAGTSLTVLLSLYLLAVFDAEMPGINLVEQVRFAGMSYVVGVDGVNILFLPLTAVIALLVLLYTVSHARNRYRDRFYVASVLGYETVLIGAFASLNVMQFWIWSVLELIPVIYLTLHSGTGLRRRWAVDRLLQYWVTALLMTLTGFLLLGFGLIDSEHPLTFDWLTIKENNAYLHNETLIFVLLFYGFAIRMPLFPFHGWLPILAEHGTVASCVIFLVGLKLGIFAVLRFILPLLPGVAENWVELALALANFGVNHHNPAKHPSPAGPVLGIWNVHGALFSVAGITAAIPHQKEKDKHLAWARRLYEFTRDHLASSYGWVAELETHLPGLVAAGKKVDTEGCAIVDMTQLAIRLARQGYPAAWNLTERFARNYMDAGQLADTRTLERDVPRKYDVCADNQGMPGRALGAFVGHGSAADFFCLEGRRGADVQNCCGSHYGFGNYFIWENIVTEEASGVHLNMLFSRDTPWCKVLSELPGRGRVTVTMRKDASLLLRLPDWVNKKQVDLHIGSRRVEPSWKEDFVHLRGLKASSSVHVGFPLRREKRKESFMGHEVEVEWLGDTVVGVSPGGTVLPLFNR